jgi:signal transduction histidine kinase/DNA-binding response OmpR family regulator
MSKEMRLGGLGLVTRFSVSLSDYLFDAKRKHPLVLPLIFFILISPVLVIAAMSYLRTERDLSDAAFSRRQTIAYLAASIVREKLDRITDIGISLATRVRFRQLVAAQKWDEANEILTEVPKDFPFIESVFLSDADGTSMANTPPLADVVGTNLAYLDWYKGVSREWKPYVSEVYRRLAEPHYNIIAVVVPIRSQNAGTVAGILGLRVRIDAFLHWTKNIEIGPEGFVYLVDRRGHVVAHPRFPSQGQIVDYSNVPVVAKALRGERGVEVQINPIEREERISAFEPVPGYGWGVVATQPTSTAFALKWSALNSILFIYGLMILLSGSLAYVILRSLAQRRKAEQELQEKNAELERQSRRIEQASRLKSEFLANMSHELRTPLNAITGFSALLVDGKVGHLSPQQKEYLSDILTSGQHLLSLINDILDLAKIESGKMEICAAPVSLTKLVGEVTDILRPIAANKRIEVQVEIEPQIGNVVTDPAKLKQVLYNYLSNALKFTPDKGKVSVRAKSEGSDAVRIEVEDNGIGIRQEDIEKLFIEFQQLDSGMAKRSQGTGLGLALCKRMVEAQGGSVGVHSAPGKGSIFYAVLPRAPMPETMAQKLDATFESVESDTPTILIIEDDEKVREWLSRTLTQAGYRIETAASGAEALAKCRDKSFATITLDLILPDMGGWELFHAIRSELHNHDTPVIILSAVSEKQAAKAFPVWDYLVKPVQPDVLLATLKQAGIKPGKGKRVLIVDDDPKILKLAAGTLKQLDYETLCVADAESGLKAAAQEQFAAVVLDLLMPGIDGFEFLERFRRTAAGSRTPVIIWTNKELTARERSRLQSSAQSIALKSRGGIDVLLSELQQHLPPDR